MEAIQEVNESEERMVHVPFAEWTPLQLKTAMQNSFCCQTDMPENWFIEHWFIRGKLHYALFNGKSEPVYFISEPRIKEIIRKDFEHIVCMTDDPEIEFLFPEWSVHEPHNEFGQHIFMQGDVLNKDEFSWLEVFKRENVGAGAA